MSNKSKNQEVKAIAITDAEAAMIANSRFSNLKCKELALVGIEIDKNSGDADAIRRQRAKLYGQILKHDLWKEDEYKNFQSMVEALFPDKKGAAYMMAGVGSRFYQDDSSDICKELADILGYSVLDKLKKLTDTQLIDNKDKLFERDADGKIIKRISQDEADKLAKSLSSKDSKDAKDGESSESSATVSGRVIDTFDMNGYTVSVTPLKNENGDMTYTCVPVVLSNVEADANDHFFSEELGESKTHLFKFKSAGLYVTVTETGALLIVSKKKHQKEPLKPSMPAFKYDGIVNSYRAGFPAEQVALILQLDVEDVRKVYAAQDRIKAVQADKEANEE